MMNFLGLQLIFASMNALPLEGNLRQTLLFRLLSVGTIGILSRSQYPMVAWIGLLVLLLSSIMIVAYRPHGNVSNVR